MPPGTRDLLASVLGERPLVTSPADPVVAPVAPPPPPQGPPGPWRLTARVGASQLQISNQPESRVIRKVELETYLRGVSPGDSSLLCRCARLRHRPRSAAAPLLGGEQVESGANHLSVTGQRGAPAERLDRALGGLLEQGLQRLTLRGTGLLQLPPQPAPIELNHLIAAAIPVDAEGIAERRGPAHIDLARRDTRRLASV